MSAKNKNSKPPTLQLRCPHCGEPIVANQERCFACGEKIRLKRLGGNLPVDYRIFILAGVLILFSLIGILTVLLRPKKPKPAKPAALQVEQSVRIQDSLRQVKTPKPETPKIQVGSEEVMRARDQLQRLKIRYEKVKSQVLGESPTKEQRDLMNQIQREMGALSAKISELSGSLTPERKKELDKEIAELQRQINNLISDFARAPKAPKKAQTQPVPSKTPAGN
ncbi:MAG: hypothetical protein ABIK47_07505 [candidate division WOR-3 bacterium]